MVYSFGKCKTPEKLTRNHPSFEPRNYGVTKLGELMRKQGYLEVKELLTGDCAAMKTVVNNRVKPAPYRVLPHDRVP